MTTDLTPMNPISIHHRPQSLATYLQRWCVAGRRFAALIGITAGLVGCAAAPQPASTAQAHLPLLSGWFDGEVVQYITTDVSDAAVARAKDGNYAPRLAAALPNSLGATPLRPGEHSATDKVYGVTNHAQGSVFASAPSPMGHGNTDTAYSPLWQLIEVTWRPGQTMRTLKSEEEVLEAAAQGAVTLTPTRVVLNCPIIGRPGQGGLPGVSFDTPAH